jgi:ribosome biogenesis GTPase
VSDEGRPVECLLRGSLKEIVTDAANPVAVGDWVWYAPQPDGTGMVEEVEPRRTKLSRPAARHRHLETVLVANVDQVVVVSSVREPEFRQGLVDRCLLAAERGGMEGVVCVNKSDLADEQAPLPRLDFYERVGYRVLVTSARTGEGVDALRAALAGRTSVLAGHSGTGKSSLLNAIQPGLKLKVGDISQSTQKGRHTTTSVTLLRLDVGGFVVDTPGIRAFGLWDLHKEDLAPLFPEIAQLIDDCQMRNCTHVHEPGCAVKQAVEAGDMAPERYDSYVSIRESLPFGAPWKHED